VKSFVKIRSKISKHFLEPSSARRLCVVWRRAFSPQRLRARSSSPLYADAFPPPALGHSQPSVILTSLSCRAPVAPERLRVLGRIEIIVCREKNSMFFQSSYGSKQTSNLPLQRISLKRGLFSVIHRIFLMTEKELSQFGHNVRKYRLENTVTASFHTTLLREKWPKCLSE